MSNLENQARELLDQSARIRDQFLSVELDLCLTGLDMGDFEFSRGNHAHAEREVQMVSKAIRTIEHLLTQIAGDRKLAFEFRLAGIKTQHGSLQSRLKATTA